MTLFHYRPEKAELAAQFLRTASPTAKLRIAESLGPYNKVTGRLGRTVLDEQEFNQRFGLEQLPNG